MSTSITGDEPVVDPREPVGALSEFYNAFNHRNFQLMELNWIDSEDACAQSPFGSTLRGWKAISRVYVRLFHSNGTVAMALHDYTILRVGETFLAIGQEQGRYVRGDGFELEFSIRASRCFREVYGRWRQYHYHGSIDDPDGLQRYQSIIKLEADHLDTADSVVFRQGRLST